MLHDGPHKPQLIDPHMLLDHMLYRTLLSFDALASPCILYAASTACLRDQTSLKGGVQVRRVHAEGTLLVLRSIRRGRPRHHAAPLGDE